MVEYSQDTIRNDTSRELNMSTNTGKFIPIQLS